MCFQRSEHQSTHCLQKTKHVTIIDNHLTINQSLHTYANYSVALPFTVRTYEVIAHSLKKLLTFATNLCRSSDK